MTKISAVGLFCEDIREEKKRYGHISRDYAGSDHGPVFSGGVLNVIIVCANEFRPRNSTARRYSHFAAC